LALG
jgi:hypothetical protein